MTPWKVSGSGRRIFASSSTWLVTVSDGSPRARAPGPAGDADDVAESRVDLLLDDQLNPPGAVDEVEEGELPHLAAGHDAPGDAQLVVERPAVLGPLGRSPDRGDLFPVGKPLRQHALRV